MSAIASANEPFISPAANARVKRAWTALAAVEDPEIPAISIIELGIVRSVIEQEDFTLEVAISPTYSGCPATEVIQQSVQAALVGAGEREFVLKTQLSPAWTTDWITPAGRQKLLAYGIAPPQGSAQSMRNMHRAERSIACPHCQSLQTKQLSEFGSTPCKALHRCRSCLEPFEYFKCI